MGPRGAVNDHNSLSEIPNAAAASRVFNNNRGASAAGRVKIVMVSPGSVFASRRARR
jgi:hypothetical protein